LKETSRVTRLGIISQRIRSGIQQEFSALILKMRDWVILGAIAPRALQSTSMVKSVALYASHYETTRKSRAAYIGYSPKLSPI
jgi:hypothetical protein